MHTYYCDAGVCTFYPGAAARNQAGDWATAWTTITVSAQAETWPAERTVCVSSSAAWDGDVPCPEGAAQSSTLPTVGAWQSDTRYLLRRGEVFDVSDSCIAYDRGGILLAPFGSADAAAPELTGVLGLGRDGRCSDNIPEDETVAAYGYDHWLEDVTLDGLRVHSVELGMAFRDVTLHNLDMDYEDQASGGGISTVSTDGCSNTDALSCEHVPLPRGLYISDSDILGSRTDPPGNTIGLMSATCISHFGLLNTTVGIGYEHNLRIECSSRVVVAHSDFLGEHIGENGEKHAITLRPEGYADEDMLTSGVRRDSNEGSGHQYDSRYSVVKDVYLGTPASVNSSVRVQIAPTNSSSVETTRWAVVSENTVDMSGGSGDGPSTYDARRSGMGLACYADNDFETSRGCGDGGQNSIPDGYYSKASGDMKPPPIPDPPATY